MSADLYISSLSPESIEYGLRRQVFWLALQTAFPYTYVQWPIGLVIPQFVGAYSYGDSTGLKPVSLLIPGLTGNQHDAKVNEIGI